MPTPETTTRRSQNGTTGRLLLVVLVLCLLLALLLGVNACQTKQKKTTGTPTAVTTAGNATASSSKATTTISTAPLVSSTTSAGAAATQLLVNKPSDRAFTIDINLVNELEQLCLQNKNNMSLFYKDLDSGATIEFRSEVTYQAASVIKAPYIKHLLAGNTDLSEMLTYKTQKSNDLSTTEYISAHYKKGAQLSVKDTMKYTLMYSDNAGYWMLNRRFDFANFRAYGKSLGCHPLQCLEYQFYYLTAKECGLYFEDIYKYIKGGSDNAKFMYDCMTHTVEKRQIPAALSQYTIAHKYGEQGTSAYHDVAIVYAEHPYLLAVLTQGFTPYSDKAIRLFHDAATLVDGIHTSHYFQP